MLKAMSSSDLSDGEVPHSRTGKDDAADDAAVTHPASEAPDAIRPMTDGDGAKMDWAHLFPPRERRPALVVPPLRLAPLIPKARTQAPDVRANTEAGLGGSPEVPRATTLKSAASTASGGFAGPTTSLKVNAQCGASLPRRQIAIVCGTALISLVASVGLASVIARGGGRVVAESVTSQHFVGFASPSSALRSAWDPAGPAVGAPVATSEPHLINPLVSPAPAFTGPASAKPAAAQLPAASLAAGNTLPRVLTAPRAVSSCPCKKVKKRNAVYDDLPVDGRSP
jgi:hypothetical protein